MAWICLTRCWFRAYRRRNASASITAEARFWIRKKYGSFVSWLYKLPTVTWKRFLADDTTNYTRPFRGQVSALDALPLRSSKIVRYNAGLLHTQWNGYLKLPGCEYLKTVTESNRPRRQLVLVQSAIETKKSALQCSSNELQACCHPR